MDKILWRYVAEVAKRLISKPDGKSRLSELDEMILRLRKRRLPWKVIGRMTGLSPERARKRHREIVMRFLWAYLMELAAAQTSRDALPTDKPRPRIKRR